jgi:hypothetical protein
MFWPPLGMTAKSRACFASQPSCIPNRDNLVRGAAGQLFAASLHSLKDDLMKSKEAKVDEVYKQLPFPPFVRFSRFRTW